MKIIGCLLVIGILLSYVPVFHMNECPGQDHSGNTKMDCGSLFHCPMIINIVVLKISGLPLNGLLIPTKMLPLKDKLANPIFHPPKSSVPNFIPRGNEGGRIIKFGTLAQELLI